LILDRISYVYACLCLLCIFISGKKLLEQFCTNEATQTESGLGLKMTTLLEPYLLVLRVFPFFVSPTLQLAHTLALVFLPLFVRWQKKLDSICMS
jgi:hypothetical protein